MSWSGKDPGKGQRQNAQTWTCHHPKGAWTLKAWMAGPPVWVLCHYMDRHLPCHHEMTDGELQCPYCPLRPRVDWIGYTPVYAASGKQLCVMIREYSRDTAMSLKLHDAVLVSRGEGRYEEVTIVPHKWSAPYVPGLPHRKHAADLSAWLPLLWRDHTFGVWAAKKRAGDTAVSLPSPKAEEKGTGNAILDDIDRRGVCRVLLGDDVDDNFRRAAAESAAAQAKRDQGAPPTAGEVLPVLKNGKHPKK